MNVSDFADWIVVITFFGGVIYWIFRFWKTLDTREEIDLLKQGAYDGRLQIFQIDAIGSWVRVGNKNFGDQSDPADLERFVSAAMRMHRKGYIRRIKGDYYVFTDYGFQTARSYVKAPAAPDHSA